MLVVKEVSIVIYLQIKVVTRRLTRPLIGESFLIKGEIYEKNFDANAKFDDDCFFKCLFK
jgi:hypothetical protein